MKKLFIYALLLVTGFAFYSCDERFDNPVTQQQDPSNPNATWTYEVSVKFSWFNTYNYDEKTYKFEAPNTLYVYNQKLQALGTITCDEEIDQDNYTADSYKFAGSLKGAIGDTLFVSTADLDWLADKQDGTLENVYKNGIMQSAIVPIIVANETTGKIGTQSITLENKTAVLGCYMYLYGTGKETAVTVSSDNLCLPNEEVNVTFAKDVKPNEVFWVALPLTETKNATYKFKSTTEKGVEIFGGLNNYGLWTGGVSTMYGLQMLPKVIDLKEVVDEYNYNGLDINIDGATITQSGEDPLPFWLYIYSKDVTIKGINFENGSLYVYPPSKATEAVLNVEGENTIKSDNNWAGMYIYRAVRLKGSGTLAVTGNSCGIEIYGNNSVWIDDNNSVRVPGSLTIEDGVTVKAEGESYGIYLSKRTGTYGYYENGKYKEGEWSDTFNNFLKVNGKLDAKGGYYGIYKEGIINVGETGTLIATSEGAYQKVRDGNITEGEDFEAKLETLVADKSKFSDEISEDKKVRTIKKK